MNDGRTAIRQGTLAFLTASALFLSACSLPRIIVLHDPLTAEEHDNLGSIYESQGKFDLALEQYREALRKDKEHLPSLLLLGDLSYRVSDYPGAESAYAKALKLDPKNGDVMNDLAWVYIRTGKNLDTAKRLISDALTLNPAHRPYYLDTLGAVLLKLGDAAGAITALQEAVDTLPRERADLLAEAEGHLADAYKAAGEETKYREAVERQKELQK
jgi:tetratricopeptide (TPR) repeat protein